MIGPLTDIGCFCPDLRGAGWSSAPSGRYFKSDMADDLAEVLDWLDTSAVRLVAHDWGPIAFLLMLRLPDKVSGFFGLNTSGPWYTVDLASLRGLWRRRNPQHQSRCQRHRGNNFDTMTNRSASPAVAIAPTAYAKTTE